MSKRRVQTIGERITRIRKSRNMTQEQVSKETGISHSYINRIESGKRPNISLDKIRMLSNSMNIPILDLVLSDDEEIDVTDFFKRKIKYKGRNIDEEMMNLFSFLLEVGVYYIDYNGLDVNCNLPLKVSLESF